MDKNTSNTSNNANNSELTKPNDLLVKATLSDPQALKGRATIHLPQQVRELINLFTEKLKLTQSDIEYMETIADGLRIEGLKEGIEIGIELGIEKEKFNTAQKMLAKNLAIELISDITGLSVAQIKTLATRDCQAF